VVGWRVAGSKAGAKDFLNDVIVWSQALSLPSGTGFFASGYSAAARNPKAQKTEQLAGTQEELRKTCLPPSLIRSLITDYEKHVRNEPRQGRRSVDRSYARLLACALSPSPHLAPHPTE
jgi:hypothetical protein